MRKSRPEISRSSHLPGIAIVGCRIMKKLARRGGKGGILTRLAVAKFSHRELFLGEEGGVNLRKAHMTHPRAKVIISYSRDDIDFAEQLVGARRLVGRGIFGHYKRTPTKRTILPPSSASVKRICRPPEAVSWPFKMASKINLAASRARTRLSFAVRALHAPHARATSGPG